MWLSSLNIAMQLFIYLSFILLFFYCTTANDVYQDECVGFLFLLVWWLSQGTKWREMYQQWQSKQVQGSDIEKTSIS